MAWLYGGIGDDGAALADMHVLDLTTYSFDGSLQVVG